jgi:UDP-glucose 4-epimerase
MDASDGILVTGGSGFLGGHLVAALRERGERVTIADRTGRSSFADVPVVAIDLLEDEVADLLSEGRFEGVFHLAGNVEVPLSVERPDHDFRLNVGTTLRLLEALRRVAPSTPMLLASTAAVYGEASDGPCLESQMPAPIAPYGASKWIAETYTELYARRFGLRTSRARIFSLYGPGLRKHVVHDLIAKLQADPERLEIHGDGLQVRDFLYVEDAVRALLSIHDAAARAGEVVNVGSGLPLSIMELAQAVARACGATPQLMLGAAEGPGRSRRWIADVSRLRALGFAPRVSLAEGLGRTVAWYRDAPAEA